MEKIFHNGAILAIAGRVVAICVGGAILGLIAPEPHSLAAAGLAPGGQRVLTFGDRVAYQYAIEEVYWRHRIWPKENPGPKPSLDEVMSRAQFEIKVEDYLRKSQALKDYWQRPITTEQLQAEMDRMASHTKQPDALREIFAALNNDPFVIAECLARPILANRVAANLTDERDGPPDRALLDLNQDFARTAVAPYYGSPAYTLPKISVLLDCVNDTWTSTTLTNAPVGRRRQTAVWTGSEMIVWGGEYYNAPNALGARSGHTALRSRHGYLDSNQQTVAADVDRQ